MTDDMPARAPLQRGGVTFCSFGAPGCGKSTLNDDLFVRDHPRVVSVDPSGDTLDRHPGATQVLTVAALASHLDNARAQRADRWHFIATLDATELPKLVTLFVPRDGDPRESRGRLWGGVLIESGEMDVLAPMGRTSPEVRGAWQRHRHHLVSIAGASHRPVLVDPAVIGLSGWVAMFRQSDPRDLAFCERAYGSRGAEAIARLEPFQYFLIRRHAPSASIWASTAKKDAAGRYIRRKIGKVDLYPALPNPRQIAIEGAG